MLKGHSVIELTDVNTGEVERYEDDNIVTNGLQYYSRYHSIPADTWKNLLSGIRLFDSQLEENTETLFAPLSVETIGYASLEADTTNPKRGLFNMAESGRLDDLSGVKLVWDFAQSQANGTIACIGITRTNSVHELSVYYSVADVYINTSVEETFGLTTVEAMACGTPSIVYDSTACPEVVSADTGFVINKGDLSSLCSTLELIKKKGKHIYSNACRNRATSFYNKSDLYRKYIDLYKELLPSKF